MLEAVAALLDELSQGLAPRLQNAQREYQVQIIDGGQDRLQRQQRGADQGVLAKVLPLVQVVV